VCLSYKVKNGGGNCHPNLEIHEEVPNLSKRKSPTIVVFEEALGRGRPLGRCQRNEPCHLPLGGEPKRLDIIVSCGERRKARRLERRRAQETTQRGQASDTHHLFEAVDSTPKITEEPIFRRLLRKDKECRGEEATLTKKEAKLKDSPPKNKT